MSASAAVAGPRAPALGEHTREVLAAAGFTAGEIDALTVREPPTSFRRRPGPMHLSIGWGGVQVGSRVSGDRRKWRDLGPDLKQSTTMLTNEETTRQR
jgi:hypothetical protein